MSDDELPRELELYAHQELELRAHERYSTIIHIGGVGSGKTVTLVGWMLDRSRWDTGQEHALFTYTVTQREQVLQRVYPWLDAIGIPHVWNCRPPAEWTDEWKRRGIPQPPFRDRFTNTIILKTGLRIQTGTLFNQAFEQWKGPEWGSVAIEEFTAGPSLKAIEWIMDRCRCGRGAVQCERHGKKDDCWCRAHHKHTIILHGNPPEDDGHWSFDWLKALDTNAARLSGEALSRADDDSYPNLVSGVGSVLYIQSSSDENEHTGSYARNLRERLDDETARRRLGGEMRRSRVGLTYSPFSHENEIAVDYRNDRTLYVNLDFNNRPIAAGLCHPLNPGEFPSEHERPGISHVGKFGEIFDTQGGGLHALCTLLLSGDVGNRGAAPQSWSGLLDHKGPVIFFGDGTGLNKTASGRSLWSIVDEVIGKQLRARGMKYSRNVAQNELVPVRVSSLNAKFKSNTGIRSFWVDPRCRQSINDYTSVVWERSKDDVQKYGERGGGDRWLLTHLSDADGYMMVALFPLGRELGAGRPSDALPKFGGDAIKIPRPNSV